MKQAAGEVIVERHAPNLPRFAVLPFDPKVLWGQTALFVADGALGEAEFTRRSVKPWGDGLRWFIDLPDPLCKAAGVDTGGRVMLRLTPRDDAPPCEIAERLAGDPALGKAWLSFPPSHRREWSRWVDEAKKPETRARRADQVVGQVRAKGGWRLGVSPFS